MWEGLACRHTRGDVFGQRIEMNRRSQRPSRRIAPARPTVPSGLRILPPALWIALIAAGCASPGVDTAAGAAAPPQFPQSPPSPQSQPPQTPQLPPSAGAQAQSQRSANETMSDRTVRVIVRFASDGGAAHAAVDADFVAEVAANAGIRRIDIVREMSGDSWVLLVACERSGDQPRDQPGDRSGDRSGHRTDDGDGCGRAVARLAASPAVRNVDVDRRERPL